MRRSIILALFSVCTVFLYGQGKYTFSGNLTSSDDIKEIYLYEYIGAKAYPFDTIKVKKGKFKKSYANFEKGLYILKVGEQLEDLVLFEDKLSISIPEDLNNMPWKSSSNSNKDYFELRKQFKAYDGSLMALDEHYKTFAHLREAQPDYFNQQIIVLRSKLDSANKAFDTYFTNLGKNGSSEYGKKVGEFFTANDQTNASNYLSKEDFKDNFFAHGDYIVRKLNYQFLKYGRLDQNNLSLSAQKILSFTTEKNLCKELMYEGLVMNMLAISENEAVTLQLQHKNEFGNTVVAKRIAEIVPPPPPTIGLEVPEIVATDKDGKEFKLSELKGKVVLIDFWASWCGPCRRESPNVVANYNKYKDQGFTVVSISADKNEQKWLEAIVHDNYTWNNHILSAANGFKAQKDFQVRGYPTMFLIDREGKLVASGGSLRGENLGVSIANLINK